MRVLATVLLAAALAVQLGLQRGVDAYEASIRTLERATTARSDGSHHALLVALRNLRDPTLKPLFHKLASGDNASLQIDAVLGLAELEPTPKVDPWLINRLGSENERTLVIKYALNANMLEVGQIQEMLQWPDLQPLPKVLLLAASCMLGRTPDPESVRPLTEASDDAIAGLASCVLRQAGETKPLGAFRSRIGALDERRRDSVFFELFRAIDEFRLAECCEFIAAEIVRPELDPTVAEAGLAALLNLKSATGLPLWNQLLGSEPQQTRLVRFGLLLLNAADRVPANAFDRLRTGERLLERMADVGQAMAKGDDASDALYALVELRHMATTSWAMTQASKLPSTSAAGFYARLIDGVDGPESGRAGRANLAIEAAAHLIEIDPQQLASKLESAPDDSLLQEAILLGLLNARTPKAGELAKKVTRLGAGRADSMALILIARYADQLTPQDVEQLGRIAAGGGRVDETLQVQAAWLYLHHARKTEQALSALLAAS